MNRFLIPSTILELQTNTVNDFIHEYVTTIIPFENLTTEKVPEAEHGGTMIIIYGIGGFLIFLVVFTFIYRYLMPDISDEARARFRLRSDEDLSERIELANLESQRNQIEVEDPLNSENPPASENLNGTGATRGDERIMRDIQRNEGPFSRIIGTVSTAIRSHTAPKQLCESHQDTHGKTENCNMTAREELQEHSNFSISEKYVKRVPSWEYFPDNLNPVTEPNQFCKEAMFLDQNPCEKDNSSIATSPNSATESPVHERRIQSAPTSPDIVRRICSSQEATPRRSSSLR